MNTLVVFVLLGLVTFCAGNACRFKSQGREYDLTLLNKASSLHFYNSLSDVSYYVKPCGSITSESQCESGAAVCAVKSSKSQAINFGTAKSAEWVDLGLHSNVTGVEITYGNGETCSNGLPRKSIVEYQCDASQLNTKSLQNSYATFITLVNSDDECLARFTVRTPFACPLADFCHALTDSASCDKQDGLCSWAKRHGHNGTCVPNEGSCWHHFANASGVLLAGLLICVFGLLACTCGLCICALAGKKNTKRAKRFRTIPADKFLRRKSFRTQKKNKKNAVVYENIPNDLDFIPLQLIPGGISPVNPYNFQGYPVVELVAPKADEQV